MTRSLSRRDSPTHPMSIQNNNTENIRFEKEAESWLRNRLQEHPDFFLLCDSNTRQHCLPLFVQRYGEPAPGHLLVMPAGESSKSIETATMLWRQLQQAGATRESLLLNLGGGVVCDMGGFVAATWKRGIPFIHIPTSLMAQADAAIGGKCALDFGSAKNQIGLICDPEAVCIFHDFLTTLTKRELRSGFAEMLKHGIIADAAYFRALQQAEPDCPPAPELLRRSVEIKCGFVREDHEDKGIRKALNFGHSIGHILEALSGGALSHGEAVAHGIRAEAYIAWKRGLLDEKSHMEIAGTMQQRYGDFPDLEFTRLQMERLLAADKKNDGRSTNFSLPERIGRVRINCAVSTEEAWAAVRAMKPENR